LNKKRQFFCKIFLRKYFKNHNIGPRSGQSIDVVEVDIYLGNLTLRTAPGSPDVASPSARDLNQFFSATFLHGRDKKAERAKPVRKSGEPGYEVGRPLIAATDRCRFLRTDFYPQIWHKKTTGINKSDYILV
jgi:hypothetical protein